jgi:hypothetical protein
VSTTLRELLPPEITEKAVLVLRGAKPFSWADESWRMCVGR